jgi:hypothetical protein
MKKVFLLSLLAIFVLPTIFALNVNVQTNTTNAVLITSVNEPVVFNLQIQNLGPSDDFYIYNLLGYVMNPTSAVHIDSGATVNVPVTIYPRSDLTYNGYYVFNYIIQNTAGDQSPETLSFKIMNLQSALQVGASQINPQSNSITIYIKNLVNFNFDNMTKFNSPFFILNQQFSLAPYETKQFDVSLNKDDFKSLLAGFYTLSAQVSTGGGNATVQGSIDFSKQNILNVSDNKYGFLITTDVIQKVNEGNVIADSQTTVQKNIISRLFTTFSPTPDTVAREGLAVIYGWDNQIQPGDALTISTRTNWLLPLFVVIFIGIIVFFVMKYTKANLSLKKSVTFLRAKGGEFALKVTVVVTARKFIEKVTIVDRLPFVAKLYEKFGAEKPTRVDEKSRRLEWHFDKLMPGETRVLSYIIYSKVGVLGRFALPTTRAVYQREGRAHEAESNQAFLVTEQSKMRED